ncbi:Uncharacterised protein [Streptococcus pneumoniae]|nr:hypothetical protein [Streptococcus pneumoniae]CIP14117.1 Uncharacterised protein [Streptococcus pneumoniae]CIP97035.1 Uncharacterised protein [Streptococcus pneumoniae]CIS51801.1 Uncharacterised protein [Streptococcus pneumoniae]CIT12122.1 Uncharacterised protein [Streptococcus pneumoniae]CIT87408.1 Uncharacterised protein [Streptococcus pneumoniae]
MNKITIRELIILFVLILFIFQNLLEKYFVYAQYIDEIVALLFLIHYFLRVVLNKSISKKFSRLVLLLLTIILITLISNFWNNVQTNILIISIDLFSIFKFIFIFLGAQSFLNDLTHKEIKRIILRVYFISNIYLSVLIVLAFLNIFIGLGMHQEYRYGLPTFSFIFGTPGQVINLSIIFLLLYQLNKLYNSKNNLIHLVLIFLLLLSTLKTRAIVLAIVFVYILYLFEIRNISSMKKRVLPVLGLGAVVGFEQFKTYFLTSDTPRLTLFKYGMLTMRRYFPLGSGFATYGSDIAAKNYSLLYYQYGFHNRYGMNPYDIRFLNDNFYPMIFAQFGFLGGILYVFLLLDYFRLLLRVASINDKVIKTSVFIYIFNVVLSSIQSSYPGTNSMVITTFLICLILRYSDKWRIL